MQTILSCNCYARQTTTMCIKWSQFHSPTCADVGMVLLLFAVSPLSYCLHMAQAENYCQSLDQATATDRCSTFLMIAILHGHYIIHVLASKRNVVCTCTMWLSQKHCFIGYTVPCKSHRGHTFHFYLYRVSELNTHKYLRERSERKYL